MNNIQKIYASDGKYTVAVFIGIILLLFSSIGLFANLMHYKNIKSFEQQGQLFTGTVIDNYYFERIDIGGSSLTRVMRMICVDTDEEHEEGTLLCTSEFISKSLAKTLPLGTTVEIYYRNDIHDSLLKPAIDHWKTSWFHQGLPTGAFILSLLMLLYVKLSKK